MSYRPLPNYLTVKESHIEGLGLFATNEIDAEFTIGITHVRDDRFQDGYIRTPLGAWFNHSETPNCEVVTDDEFIRLKTIKKINKGEELTAKYTLYDPSKTK